MVYNTVINDLVYMKS